MLPEEHASLRVQCNASSSSDEASSSLQRDQVHRQPRSEHQFRGSSFLDFLHSHHIHKRGIGCIESFNITMPSSKESMVNTVALINLKLGSQTHACNADEPRSPNEQGCRWVIFISSCTLTTFFQITATEITQDRNLKSISPSL